LLGWDDGRIANRPAPALALDDGDRVDLSTDGQAPTGHVAHLPHALGREQREDPSTVPDRGCLLNDGVALRPAAIDPRRARAPTKVRIAPNDSVASGCRDGTSSCLPSTPWFSGDLPMPG
jgi:hypothetical protein